MIAVEHAEKSYKGVKVLDDVSLFVPTGCIAGFQGINGSGKTMLMRAICGLIHLDSGFVKVDGAHIGKDRSFPESVGVLIEGPAFLPAFTGLENLQLIAEVKGIVTNADVQEVIERVGLDPSSRKKYKEYSLGMKQRLGIAAAIMEKPDLVILDEPSNALDESGVEMLRGVVRECAARGATILLTCHDREFLMSLSDIIFTMECGKVHGPVRGENGRDEYDADCS